jgi:hypothetical protein
MEKTMKRYILFFLFCGTIDNVFAMEADNPNDTPKVQKELTKLYKSVREFKNQKQLFDLTPSELINILTNTAFKTDNEDSIFLIVALYLNGKRDQFAKEHIINNRIIRNPSIENQPISQDEITSLYVTIKWNDLISEDDVTKLCNAIIWYDITPTYFKCILPDCSHRGVVYHAVKKLNHTVVTGFYEKELDRRIKKQAAPKYYSRLIVDDPDDIEIKYPFKDPNSWEIGGKYYCSPVIYHGYMLYYFLQHGELVKDGQGNYLKDERGNILYNISGFLRCTNDICEQYDRHYFPLTVQPIVVQPEEQDYAPRKKYAPTNFIFEEQAKAVGGPIFSQDEWQGILAAKIDGKNPYVTYDAEGNKYIIIIVRIKHYTPSNGALLVMPNLTSG